MDVATRGGTPDAPTARDAVDARTAAHNKTRLGLRRDLLADEASCDMDGAALDRHVLVLRYFGRGRPDHLIVVNLGPDLDLASCSEPLIAPPAGGWSIRWSSEAPEYGGSGTPPLEEETWPIPGNATIVLAGETATGDVHTRHDGAH